MKTINEVYAGASLEEITAKLTTIGYKIETFRRKGVSLSEESKSMIQEAREAAKRFGLSQQMINAIEREGAEAVRS